MTDLAENEDKLQKVSQNRVRSRKFRPGHARPAKSGRRNKPRDSASEVLKSDSESKEETKLEDPPPAVKKKKRLKKQKRKKEKTKKSNGVKRQKIFQKRRANRRTH